MKRQFNINSSTKSITNFALLFLLIFLSLMAYMFFVSLWALITSQAILIRAILAFIESAFGAFMALVIVLPYINYYDRIRVAEEGLYVEVYVLRYMWKLVEWKDVLDIRLLPNLDRWRKSQWLIRVNELTCWHRWISWEFRCGSKPGILITSDLIDREELLKILDEKITTVV